ncbi:bifunctional serine/threonine-protein kinase/formylglycine-generating enzyme family protein [Colwellia echini]|uniref:Protein kinase n=1 Tax=Colwellia echini TaxID=1982103 RepID=A0ABY3MW46_9GAMM|nr:bifunctional serine/threonine-protein kinase/formylglycine-generating enzyme family protein [Colwellia echini]TYK65433.1 protein kinase [Colwellia echini]
MSNQDNKNNNNNKSEQHNSSNEYVDKSHSDDLIESAHIKSNNTEDNTEDNTGKTVFRKPISKSKAQEIAKAVALAKEKSATDAAQLSTDKTVFAPRAPVKPTIETDNSQNDVTRFAPSTAQTQEKFATENKINDVNSDKTVFAPRVAPQPTVKNFEEDATRFSPNAVTSNNGLPSESVDDVNSDKTIFSPRIRASEPTTQTNGGSAVDLINGSSDFKENAQAFDTISGNNSDNTAPNLSVDTTSNANGKLKLLKGRFQLEDILGIGGMGVVYKAKDLLKVEAQDRDPYIAIKVLSEEFRTHPEAFISLQREAKKAQHIANQNTVKVYDFDRDGDVVFMTMEYMVGQPLDQMVKQYHATGLPRNEAWNILYGMCEALIHAHKEDIVHSDLKPGNVFVTDNGTAKIFDFGIARAVQKIDRSHNEKDRTVFDAGNLGALTPAYASREMLLGQVPDVRDDIYALGCIAYEILTGDHPFTRLPADEAYDKKLKPKRIQGIKKRYWKAIEAALAFERKDRIVSVAAFYKQITEHKTSTGGMWFGIALTLGLAGFAYHEVTKVELPKVSQAELMNKMEFKIRYQVLQENIERFIASPSFSREWQASLREEVQSMADLFPEKPTPWYFTKREEIYQLYSVQIGKAISATSFTRANELIKNAIAYTDDQTELDQYKLNLATKLAEKAASDKKAAEAKRLAEIEKQRKAAINAEKAIAKKEQAVDKKTTTNLYNLAMDNVKEQLQCSQRLNMRDFKIAIEKLRTLDFSRYQKAENDITKSLASCIVSMGQISPDYAKDAKRYALLLFADSAELAAVEIKELDGCQMSIAGLGARGNRAVCKDTLKVGGTGPTMLVIPGNDKIQPFAIGKYEVSIYQYNVYCNKSQACSEITSADSRLPVTNISLANITGYIDWLNKATGKTYRLPHKREWLHAAKSNDNQLDSNRNCQISSRGIQKGDELIKTTTGKQNSWGVVNYAGNAQELVYVSAKKVAAVGGSYQTAMDVCTSEETISHTGEADKVTGFRLVRDLVGN